MASAKTATRVIATITSKPSNASFERRNRATAICQGVRAGRLVRSGASDASPRGWSRTAPVAVSDVVASSVTFALMTHRLPSVDGGSSVTDPGIEDTVQDVGDQVAEHDEHGSQQEDTHQDRVVANRERVEEEATHAGPGEDSLGQHRTGQQERHVD